MKSTFFSVVIPCYERPDDLRRCLESLSEEKQRECPKYEIIVSDDSKSNDCKRLIEEEFPLAKWDSGKKKGPGANRNAGAARAKGNWIVFIDDDCVAQEGYLKAYSEAIIKHSKVELFEGKIFPDRPKRTWAETCPENSEGSMFWTSNLCVNRSTFEELGGFDETFEVAYEDVDFAYRVKKAGKQTHFVKAAATCHPWRTLRQEGNNWKPKGFELKELLFFLEKHPNADEHASPTVYLRHLFRMLTRDLATCTFKFKGRGIDVLWAQIKVTIIVIFTLSRN